MKTNQLVSLIKETFGKMLSISESKGQEYAGSDDRLANFKRLGSELSMAPEKALWVYLTKHMDSLRTYIKDQESGLVREYSEPITGRIDDAILYLILLKALVVEREDLMGDLQDLPDYEAESGKDFTIPEWQASIAEWADTVYPSRTAYGSLSKLVLEEIPEFITSGMEDPLEYADLMIMILDIAYLKGINVSGAMQEKMELNKSRTWRVDPGTGVMKHIDKGE